MKGYRKGRTGVKEREEGRGIRMIKQINKKRQYVRKEEHRQIHKGRKIPAV
jgi:hypothetical protein